jgi:3-methyladenine DNA glycosylase AlkD
LNKATGFQSTVGRRCTMPVSVLLVCDADCRVSTEIPDICTMTDHLKAIQQLLKQNSLPEAKAAHEKFVPGGKEKIYGVRTPVLNGLAKQYKAGGFELVEALWQAGAFEEKLLALKMLGLIAKKDPARSLKLVQVFSKSIGNWAVCDAMGMQALKPIMKTHQEEIFELAGKYNHSTDFWQRRLSLVLVEWYTRTRELHPAIKKLVKSLENDEEYYVRKAVVWVNKNFQKGK